jgi:hypothetical protein
MKRKIGIYICLLVCLVGLGFVKAPVDFHQSKLEDDTDPLRPEAYLFYVEDMSEEQQVKFSNEGFININCMQRKYSNLYVAENTVRWADMGRIETMIMVGVPGYWDGYYLRGEDRYDRVNELEGIGDYALLMESGFSDEIRFIKGNSFVSVSIVGGESSDIIPIAEGIASALPTEMPSPDLLELVIPEPAREIQLPGKYIYNVYKTKMENAFPFSAPDTSKMYLVSRYPFTQFTLGLWSVEQNDYLLVEQKTVSVYDLWVLSVEHNARAFGYAPGEYELHYWVNGEFAARYPYRILGEDEE